MNEAIAYYRLFKDVLAACLAEDPDYTPLNIASVFSPPANGDKDVKQLQEDLPQEKADNQQEPEQNKAALQEIIADYNRSEERRVGQEWTQRKQSTSGRKE